ncbi:J domain-containing protein [Saccharibacillus sp. JS10]|uniref:J domain-containing protein n=1 Tax=Saccharibacillus sp. JS10 TaxID=2950552 RepID=UPI0021091B11|nr:J domain-containing protein [Saccharibacillus sp. JS10]MCQ4085264.1 tetratricopeptide repeat protein [Saccharibacillus sp. JS10]
MNIWATLGIEPTSEIKAIKRAYARRLKEHHPEEDPENFQLVRSAYEAALEEAKLLQQGESVPLLNQDELEQLRDPAPAAATPGEESPIRIFLQRCEELYADITSRVDPEEWQSLLDDELFWPIETRERIGDALFGFLLKHPFVPQQVLHQLDRHFEWMIRERKLAESYDQAQITLFMERFSTFWELRYDRLWTDEPYDYDAFLQFREQAHYALAVDDLELAEKALKGAALLHNREPDCLRLIAVFYMRKNQLESALQVLQEWIEDEPEEPEALLMRAEAQFRSQRWEQALADYTSVLTSLPGSIHALSGIAACQEALDQPWEAKAIYENLCAYYPEDLDAQIRLLNLNNRLAAETTQSESDPLEQIQKLAELYLDTGRPGECVDLLLEAENQHPLYAELNFLLGKAFGKMERYAESEQRLHQAIAQTESEPSKQADILKLRGLIRIALARYEEARSDLTRVLKLQPSDPEALYRFGESLRMEGKYEEALLFFNHALNLSSNWYYHSARGDCFYSLRQYPEALLDYLRVIQYDRGLNEAWFRAGYCFLRIGDYPHALEYFGEAQERGFPQAVQLLIAEAHFRSGDLQLATEVAAAYNEERPEEYYGLIVEGDLYRMSQRYEEALERYRRSAHIAANEYLPLRLTAEMLLKLHRVQEASVELDRLVQHYPQRGWAHLQRIRLRVEAGQWKEAESAIVYYTEQVEPKAQDTLVLLYGGYILMRMAQYEQALQFLEAASKVGLHQEVAEYLVRCYAAIGKYEQAEKVLAQALEIYPHDAALLEISEVLKQRHSRKWKLLRRLREVELPPIESDPQMPEPQGEPLPDIHGF